MGEKELVKRCQKGDKKAFEELVERFYPYVSGFLLKTTRNSILAEGSDPGNLSENDPQH